jgi:hypothetical protein
MKFLNSISKSHQTFASVFLAFSLFGFLLPHHGNEVKRHQLANVRTSEQISQTKTDDSIPQYQWFY